MRALALFFGLWLQYLIITINTRAIAQGRYVPAALTDALIALAGFTLLKLLVVSSSAIEIGAYCLGGVLGGLSGIYLTRRWDAGTSRASKDPHGTETEAR